MAEHCATTLNDSNIPIALVVDDDAFIRLGACDILTDAGFRTLEAAGVNEALALLEQHAGEITLLFTDVELDGPRDGFKLARLAARRWPDVAVLVASGGHTPGPEDLPEGAVFITKPFSKHVVHDRLQELLPDGAKAAPLKRRDHA